MNLVENENFVNLVKFSEFQPFSFFHVFDPIMTVFDGFPFKSHAEPASRLQRPAAEPPTLFPAAAAGHTG